MLLDDEKTPAADAQENLPMEDGSVDSEDSPVTAEDLTAAVVDQAEEETPSEDAPLPEEEDELFVARAEEEVEILAPDTDELELPIVESVASGSSHDDFDWSMDKRGNLVYPPEEREALLRQYDAALTQISENEIVCGRVSAITAGDVVLDINYKSDGLVSLNEFRDVPELKRGDEVEVYIEKQEDSEGQLTLSRKKAKILRAWQNIVDAYKNGTIITGTVISKTKGGLIVDCNGLETFLPGSQIDIKPVTDYDQYVGKTMEFKVVKINEQIKNAVISHKALIESDLAEQREQILSSLERGQVLEGIVKNITDFGAFLDLGGVDGLLYITDISWGRISHPSEVLQINQRLHVVVLDFDENKKRISLGLKQLSPHPWEVLPPEVAEGAVVKGRVVNIEDYGAFVEIIPGVEGLIHVSEVTWSSQSVNAREYFTIGQQVEARIVTLDRAEKKMSLSIKQLTPDPWTEIDARFPVGSRHTGTVRNMTNYGIFVELAEGIGGMVHISDLSWTKRYNHPSEFTKVGEPIEVVVLEIDREKRQISLGHKQIEENPWDTFESIYSVGSYHEGTIVRRDEKGAVLQLSSRGAEVEAFIPAKHLRKEDNTLPEVGDALTVKIIEFYKDDRRILASHVRYWEDVKQRAEDLSREEKRKEQAEAQAVIGEIQKKVEKETLGDLEALAQLKKQFSDSKKKES
jgi:small subunit ribosomal protein S1